MKKLTAMYIMSRYHSRASNHIGGGFMAGKFSDALDDLENEVHEKKGRMKQKLEDSKGRKGDT